MLAFSFNHKTKNKLNKNFLPPFFKDLKRDLQRCLLFKNITQAFCSSFTLLTKKSSVLSPVVYAFMARSCKCTIPKTIVKCYFNGTIYNIFFLSFLFLFLFAVILIYKLITLCDTLFMANMHTNRLTDRQTDGQAIEYSGVTKRPNAIKLLTTNGEL